MVERGQEISGVELHKREEYTNGESTFISYSLYAVSRLTKYTQPSVTTSAIRKAWWPLAHKKVLAVHRVRRVQLLHKPRG